MGLQKITRLLIVWLCAVLMVNFSFPGLQAAAEANAADVPASVQLDVDANTVVAPMKGTIRGTNIGLWTNNEFHPVSSRSQRYVNLIKEAGITLIRFPAGSEADSIYWDRTNTYKWYQGPAPYAKTLTAATFDSYMDMLDEVGAEALVTVNARINNSAMAADLVRYANVEKGYNIKYWEIGNEPEYYGGEYKITPVQFAVRIEEYTAAMKAVDPSIIIVGPANGGITGLMTGWVKPTLAKLHEDNKPVDAISVHWYPLAGDQTNPASSAYPSIENLLTYEGTDWQPSYINWADKVAETMPVDNLISYRDQYAPNALIGLTELGQVTSKGEGVADSLAGALWLADVLGRFAYHHIDYITQFLLQGDQTYSLFNISKELRPAYYVYPLLTRYFGDTMVSSSTSDNQNFTVWASKRTGVDDKLYVMVVNKNLTQDLQATLNLAHFNPQSTASAWVLNGPAANSLTGTNINGIQVAQDGTLADIAGTPVTGVSNSYTASFPAHSVTMLELTAKPEIKQSTRYLGQYVEGVSERKAPTDYPGSLVHTPQGFGKVWATGAAQLKVNFPETGVYDFTVRAYGEGVNPSFRIVLDGQAVPGAGWSLTNGWNNYQGSLGTVTAGIHTIKIHNNSPTSGNNLDLAHVDIVGVAPAPISLKSPANNATIANTSVTLDWMQTVGGKAFTPFGADDYLLTVADNPQFLNPVVNRRVTATSYELTGLQYNKTYYWKVAANNTNGSTSSEAVFSFTVDGQAARYWAQYADTVPERKTAADLPGNLIDTPEGWGRIGPAGSARWSVQFPETKAYNVTASVYGEGVNPLFQLKVDGQNVPDTAWLAGSAWNKYTGSLGSIPAGVHTVEISNSSLEPGTSIDVSHIDILGAAPAPFQLASPANHAVVGPTVVLDWTQQVDGKQFASLGANDYTVIVADNAELANPVLETTVASTAQLVNDLAYNKTYYWSVEANNANDSTPSGAIFRFTTPAPPATPAAARHLAQYAPAMSERKLAGDYPGSTANTPNGWGKIWMSASGKWSVHIPRAGSYQAVIRALGEGTAATFEVRIDGVTVTGSSQSLTNNKWVDYQVSLGTLPAGKHTVEIRNSSAVTGNNVDVAHLDIAGAAPGPFTLMQPANEAIVDPAAVTLDWTQVVGTKTFVPFGASNYQVIVADNAGLLNPVINTTVTTTTYQVDNLQYQSTYYWKVTANNANGSTPADAVFRFTTPTAPDSYPAARYLAQYAPTMTERKAAADYPGNTKDTPQGWGKIWMSASGKWTVHAPRTGIYNASIRALGEGTATFEVKIDGVAVSRSSRTLTNKWVDYQVGLGVMTAGNHIVELRNSSPVTGNNVDVAHLDINGAAPGPFTLMLPGNGATVDPLAVTLDWTQMIGSRAFAPFGADHYNITLADNVELLNPLVNSTVTGTTYQVNNLQHHSTYYWKVTANNANGSTPADAVFHFTTGQ
ncbi:MAG: Endoglucanase precursor [Paenibacillaceae bacterium]|jgi:alpha-L-arabinofuranosidase|nr:Endoglucanase precursor [Paenibacillaceae bacterium]